MKIIREFLNLTPPEQWWILLHPIAAFRARSVTQKVVEIALEMVNDKHLDGNHAGGQVDAFRHCYWMACLTQKIGTKKARTFGVAHEAGNKYQYKKQQKEDGIIPDYIAGLMDLKNNEIGILFGSKNLNTPDNELIDIIKKAVIDGELWKIKTDISGNFLDWKNTVIPIEKWQHKWNNPKCLVPSNYSL